jgi:hypothetical protein
VSGSSSAAPAKPTKRSTGPQSCILAGVAALSAAGLPVGDAVVSGVKVMATNVVGSPAAAWVATAFGSD